MKTILYIFRFFTICLVVSFEYNCAPLALTGKNNNSTLLGALVAASSILPGLSDVPRDENGQPIIPDNKSYIRIKLQDDPIPPPLDQGLVHFVVDYKDISHDVYISGVGNKDERKQFDYFTLTIDSIEVKSVGKDKQILPAPQSTIRVFEKDKRYSALINNLRLPAGEYEYLIVNLYELHGNGNSKNPNQGNGNGNRPVDAPNTFHQISIENILYPLNFIKKRIQFTDHFKVEKGKLSTLHAKPTQPKVIHYQKNNAEYRSQVEFESKRYSIHLPIDKIWLTMKSISVTKSSGEEFVLNDTEYRFDLLSLRGTAVLLVGNDMIPAGTYSHFMIKLKDGSSIELENESQPLQIINDYNRNFRIAGPFELRGGRMTEIILDFDPNLSVFQSLDSGYVLEPNIRVVSIMSMTPEQDIRVQTALKDYANIVVKEADVIFQGKVNSLNYVLGNNIYGKSMVYTDLSLQVTDKLRGEVSNPDNFLFRNIGGIYQNKTLEVKGMPDFSSNETFILFLKKQGEGYSLVRGEMGKVSLSGTRLTVTEKNKWNGLNPVVKYSINPNITYLTPSNVEQTAKSSGLQWFSLGKANFAFLHNGIGDQTFPRDTNTANCQNAVLSGGDAKIFFRDNFDTDCTGNSCVFLWKCGSTIVQSDVQLNSVATRWTFLAPVDSSETNLQSELLHDFGHIAGVEHCKIGDTESMCSARLGNFWADFTPRDAMYRIPSYMEKIAANDIQALQKLYGILNLPFPADGKYALNEEDMQNVIAQIELENMAGLGSIEGRKKAGEYLAALANYNRKRTGKDLLTQYNEFESKVKGQMSGFDSDDLTLQRKLLTTGIYTAYKSKQDAQNGYLSFDPNFIEYTIQKHLELRALTIDAIGEGQ